MDKRAIKMILETALSKGGDFAEVYIEQKETTLITCEDSKIERINAGIDSGIGIRVISGDNTSYAYTNNLDLSNVKMIAEVASNAAQSQCVNPVLDFMKAPCMTSMEVKIRPDQVSLDDKVKQIKIADESARALNESIRQVSLNYSDTCQKVIIANSIGTYVQDERIRTRLACNAIAREKDDIQTGFASLGSTTGFELFADHDPQVLGEESAERAIRLLNAGPCPAGKMPVVMAKQGEPWFTKHVVTV